MPDARYTPESRDDVDETYRAYEARLAGLGERFLTTLRSAIRLIESNPELYGEIASGVRAAPLRRFPQVVYYRITADSLLVIAIRHGRDDPSIWSGRAGV